VVSTDIIFIILAVAVKMSVRCKIFLKVMLLLCSICLLFKRLFKN